MSMPAPRSLGRYDLVDLLGAGGMGEVYRAYDRTTGEVVAVKLLRAGREGATVERFRREAAVHLRIRHPHVARAHRLIETHDGLALVLDYIDGPTLAEHLRAHAPLHPDAALPLFEPIVSAVAHLHRQGVLHRDIKPENVRLTRSGSPRLLDFGIAKDTVRDVRQSSVVIGSTPYMAPERLRGEPAVPATDVWALGVLLYEMLTGICPFDGSDLLDVYTRIREARFAPPSHHNPDAAGLGDALVGRCLRADAHARFDDAGALLRVLEQARAPEAHTPRRAWNARWTRPALAAGMGAALLGIGAMTWQAVSLGPAALPDTTQTYVPNSTLADGPGGTRDTVCLMTQGGRTAEVFSAAGQPLGTLGSGCLPFAGRFGETYTLTFRHDGATFTQPVTITHRRAWIVQLPH